jgi:hypothetical protein
VQQDVAEATALGDEMKKIVDTSLDKPREITALAAMDEQERQQIIERAVAGETVSALKPERMSEESKTTPSLGMSVYQLRLGSPPFRRGSARLHAHGAPLGASGDETIEQRHGC